MKIAFIGTGNMGGALAKAASADKANQLYLVNRTPEKAEALQKETGGTVTDLDGAVPDADLVFLGIKPAGIPELCEEIRPLLDAKTTVVSMAAGVTVAQIKEKVGDNPVIRIMPNTPVSVGEGMILYSCDDSVSADSLISSIGSSARFLKIEERLMNAGMAVSGCGPAFVDMFVEAMADAGVAEGLPREDATMLAAQTALGAAKLILESGKTPAELRDAVCSPGGSTIRGVRKLEENGFRSAVMEAIDASANGDRK